MNLNKKKKLAAKTLKVGANRIHFNSEHLADIKEAITKQDIKDLVSEGIITIKPIKGRKKIKKRKSRRGPGKIKKTINKRKQIYVKITRKLRRYTKELKNRGSIDNDLFLNLQKKIKMRNFKSKAHLKEYLAGLEVTNLGEEKTSKNKKSDKKETKTEKQEKSKKTKSQK